MINHFQFTLLLAVLSPWLFIIYRRYYYKKILLDSLPRVNSLSDYQNDISCIKDKVLLKNDKQYYTYLLKAKKFDHLPYLSVMYRFFYNRHFAYNQFPLVFISSYGNISEVSRRKYSSADYIKDLQSVRDGVCTALSKNNADEIIFSLANVYRVMYDLFASVSEKANMSMSFIKIYLYEVSVYMDEKDLVNAYICWRSIDAKLKNMSDIEILIYGSIRLHLEKYIISYKYPVVYSQINEDLSDFSNMLKAIIYWMENQNKYKIKFVRSSCLFLVLDMLCNGLKYR